MGPVWAGAGQGRAGIGGCPYSRGWNLREKLPHPLTPVGAPDYEKVAIGQDLSDLSLFWSCGPWRAGLLEPKPTTHLDQ